ncbi:MAG: UDP-N-acetylmuramoyl-L-alanine--D-glutamate ligase [Pseudomonadota bacterium]
MFPLPHAHKKKYGVFGLGASGLATCAALQEAGADVFCWDEAGAARDKTAQSAYSAVHPKEWPWSDLEALVLAPGVPLTHPKPHVIVRKAVQENVPVIGDIELFAQAVNALDEAGRPTVVAVTGSNGKSTTTALIGHILNETGARAYVGGNIGEAILSLPAPSANAVYVLELSSYQLDLARSLRVNTAVLLNISPDHLDRHGTMERYVAAKRRIFLHQTQDDRAVIGVGDAYTQAICAELTSERPETVVPFSATGALGRGVFALDGRLYYRVNDKNAEAGDISDVEALRGHHNAANAAAALAVVMGHGVAPSVAVRSMERFRGLAHRMETIARRGPLVIVNDSKATNVEAAAKALQSFGDVYWIAGGRAKDGGVDALSPLMERVRGAYLIGEAADAMAAALQGDTAVQQCGDLETAVAAAMRDAGASDAAHPVVLLSPACASQDQFKNFEERGETFRRLVMQVLSAVDDDGDADNGNVGKNGAAA